MVLHLLTGQSLPVVATPRSTSGGKLWDAVGRGAFCGAFSARQRGQEHIH